MSKNKIIWIIVLIVIVGLGVGILINAQPQTNDNNTTNQVESRKTDKKNNTSIETENNESTESKETVITKLEDGTLYSLSSEKVKADYIVGDNYFDTQITDMMMNYNSYKGKKIEIEGMYLENLPYVFVGRYSTSNLCPTCPAGYSYMEYEWDGEKIELEDEKTWIKVIGTLQVGNDETSDYQDYYYIKAISIEVMDKWGKDTVNN